MKRLGVFAAFALALASLAGADDEPAAKLPLDVLLETPISTAAKYDQQLSSVAASVTVITAEEIERYGWTSISEVLQAIRGFYITYDRNYTYVGLRGIGRPTDYNSRLLILIDGHRLNNALFGSAPGGDDMALDLSNVAKIEIVRGPGSALYGTHAMFAVINVITKSADALDDVSFTFIKGSHQKNGASVRAGRVFTNGMRVTATGYWQETNGADIFFPEYNSPDTNNGVAHDLDYEDLHRFGVTLQYGGFDLRYSTRERTKGTPTASYDSDFNAAPANVMNRQDIFEAQYHRNFGTKTIELRAYHDRASYKGFFQYGDTGIDRYVVPTNGGEARFQWDIRANHRLTAGTEYMSAPHLDYTYKVGTYTIDLNQADNMTSYYFEYEGHPTSKLGLVAGLRRDDYHATADSTNPRAAILFTPNRNTTLKLLYGSAFRSPNVYEAFYSDPLTPWKAHPDLKPETIRATELVLEHRLSPELLVMATAFHISASGLIESELEPMDKIYWYNNIGSVESTGAEAAVHLRMKSGLWARFSASSQRVTDSGSPADNAPRFLVKGGVSTSPWAPLHAGVEAVFEGGRRTRNGGSTDNFLVVNGTVSRRLAEHFRLGLTAHDLLNAGYSTPVGPELRPQSIRQDGRTLTLKLTYTR
jgi:outer membrane receptor protein involved in Fe transport